MSMDIEAQNQEIAALRSELEQTQARERSMYTRAVTAEEAIELANARTERAIEGLRKIVAFTPTDDPALEQEWSAACDANKDCAECQRARQRQWPPSGLCDEHFTLVDKVRQKQTNWHDYQKKYGPKQIAADLLRDLDAQEGK